MANNNDPNERFKGPAQVSNPYKSKNPQDLYRLGTGRHAQFWGWYGLNSAPNQGNRSYMINVLLYDDDWRGGPESTGKENTKPPPAPPSHPPRDDRPGPSYQGGPKDPPGGSGGQGGQGRSGGYGGESSGGGGGDGDVWTTVTGKKGKGGRGWGRGYGNQNMAGEVVQASVTGGAYNTFLHDYTSEKREPNGADDEKSLLDEVLTQEQLFDLDFMDMDAKYRCPRGLLNEGRYKVMSDEQLWKLGKARSGQFWTWFGVGLRDHMVKALQENDAWHGDD